MYTCGLEEHVAHAYAGTVIGEKSFCLDVAE